MPKVRLAVGHGTKPNGVTHDPGAVNSLNGWSEQSAGDIVVGEVEKVLAATGAFELQSEARDPDDPNWVGTAREANAWGADLTVAWHHDWSGSRLGGHGFWFPGSVRGEQVVRTIMKAHEAILPVSWSWVKPRSDLGLLRSCNHPAALIECGPIGHMALDSVEELRAVGRAHASAILDLFGVDRNKSKEQDMAWLDKWPKVWRTWAKRALDRGVITENTDPNKKVADVTLGELLIHLDAAADGERGKWGD